MSNSPAKIAWKKFRKNIPAVFGVGYLILCLFASIFGYLLVPDNTQYANFQMLELAKKPPGTSITILLVPRVLEQESKFWLFTGKTQNDLPIPLKENTSISLENGRINFTTYAGAEDYLSLTTFGLENGEISQEDFEEKYLLNRTFLLGTDTYGRDLLSRIILGARISLSIGLMSVLISLVIGVFLGVIAGYFGGWVDQVIMWLVSVMWSIPTLLLALAISFVLGKGFWQLFVAIGVSMWVEVARIVRGQIMSVREQPFTEAAKALGFEHLRIMFKHILPNVTSPIIVIAVANFGAAVLIESGLSFLGIGVEVPIPTWGRMIYEGYTYIVFENGKWLAFFPGLALIMLVVSINLIGIGLRDALDVKM